MLSERTNCLQSDALSSDNLVHQTEVVGAITTQEIMIHVHSNICSMQDMIYCSLIPRLPPQRMGMRLNPPLQVIRLTGVEQAPLR